MAEVLFLSEEVLQVLKYTRLLFFVGDVGSVDHHNSFAIGVTRPNERSELQHRTQYGFLARKSFVEM